MVSSTVSSTPACSPARTRLRYNSSKCTGCLVIASLSDEPPSMLARISSSIAFKRGFLVPPAMISKDCTIGTPDCIMVAIWRLKMAMSRAVMALPAWPNKGLDLGFTTPG
jgi:hypothetical protein